MTKYKKLYELVHLANRALANCHYHRAEKLIVQIILDAQKTNDDEIFKLAQQALTDCQRFHFLDVLRILKRIDPIQALRKDQS